MSFRHVAALASIGWYLMVPQAARREPLLLETNKPFSQWERVRVSTPLKNAGRHSIG